MTTQEKNKAIAKWLGIDVYSDGSIWDLSETKYKKWQPAKDRNQQKLIEDKLIEMGYEIQYYHPKNGYWIVTLKLSKKISKFYHKLISVGVKENKSKDIAFIDAVIELIKSK